MKRLTTGPFLWFRRDYVVVAVLALCVIWADRRFLTLSSPILLENRDNLDIVYPLLDFFFSGLKQGHINFYHPFQWAGTRLFGDPNFQINIFEIVTGILFDTRAIFVGLNFMFIAERIIAALGMYALIAAICPALPRYLRGMLALLYVFSSGYAIAEAFPTASVHFAVAPWLLFLLTVNKKLSTAVILTAMTAFLFVQFSYGQLQLTVYLGWLLLSFIAFYIPLPEKTRALSLLVAAGCMATLLSAYYVVPLLDNLFLGDGGPGGRVSQGLDVARQRVPPFYLARLFVPQVFGLDSGIPWWPTARDGWSPWESFSAFQGIVLSLLSIFGIFLKRVPFCFKLVYLFIAFSVTFRPGLYVLHVMNLGTSVPYGRQTILLGIIAPIITAFALKEIAENRKTAMAFAVWCGLCFAGLLAIYVIGFPKAFVDHAYWLLNRTFPGAYPAGQAEAFYKAYAVALKNAFATPVLLTGLAAAVSLGVALMLRRQQARSGPAIAYAITSAICLLSLWQAFGVYQMSKISPTAEVAAGPSRTTRHPAEAALIAVGAQAGAGPVAYRVHPDIYFGEHRQGTISVGGKQFTPLRAAGPQDDRFRTLANFLASERVPVTSGYSSLIPQAQRFTELMMWTPNHGAMERAIGERTKLHPALLEAFAVKWVLRHQPSVTASLQGRPDWSNDPWEQRFLASAKLIYSDEAYRLYEYQHARPAIDIPDRIAFGTNAVSVLNALEEIDKAWIPTAALPLEAMAALAPELKASIVTERGQPMLRQTGQVLDTGGVAGRWTKLTVKTEKPTIVLLGIKFDKWWRVRVNGQPVPLIRANSVFAAAQVPAGTSEVVVELRPWSAWVGLGVSAGALIGMLVWLFVYMARNRTRRWRSTQISSV